MASHREIAKRSGVARSTVSKVLSGHHYDLAADTRERVLATARQLGVVGAEAPQARRRSGEVGVIAHDRYPAAAGVYENLPMNLTRELEVDALRPIWITMPAQSPRWSERRRYLHLDAALLIEDFPPELADDLLGTSMPMAALNGPAWSGRIDTVLADDRAAGRDIARLLLDQGHHRVLYASMVPAAYRAWHDRLQGLRDLPGLDIQVASTETMIRDALSVSGTPTALVSASGSDALQVLPLLHHLRLASADRLSHVAGNDLAVLSPLGITAIDVPMVDMAHQAVLQVRQRMARVHQAARTTIIPCRLVLRGSVVRAGR